MTNQDILDGRISAVRQYLGLARKYSNLSKEELLSDPEKRGALERYLYLSIQASIDLAESVISFSKFRKAQSLAENFEILGEEGVLTPKQVKDLTKMVGFRNILSHAYHKIDYDVVINVLHIGYKDIEELLSQIEKLKV